MKLPPEIAAVVGLRVDPVLWRENTRTGIESLLAISPRTEKQQHRLDNLRSYAAAVHNAAVANRRTPLHWLEQPTGRWSTEKPNLHSISKSFGLRDAVIPEEGRVFVRGDWASAHLVIAAGLSADPVLIADLETGDAYDRATRILVPELHDVGRPAAKILILSALNGAGPEKLAESMADFGVDVTPHEAHVRRGTWLARYPELGSYLRRATGERSWTTPLGRVVSVPEDKPAHKGLGWRWQSYEADALTLTVRRISELHPQVAVAFLFYDEVLLESARESAEDVRADLASVMDATIREVAGIGASAAELVKTLIRSTWSGVEPAKPVLEVVPMSTVTRTPVEWLWPDRAPFGGITVFDGDPGTGKTTIVLDIAAQASRGYLPVPDSPPLNVLVISHEDSVEHTIAPRLEAAQADLTRIFTHKADSDHAVFDLAEDLRTLEALLLQTEARVLILDPLSSFIGADTHKDAEVRRVLRPLDQLAKRHNVAVLAIRHLRKSSDGPALYRGGGSIAIVGAARAAHLIAKDPASGHLIVACTKTNLGPAPQSLACSLLPPWPPGKGGACKVQWHGAVDLTADDLVGARADAGAEKTVEAVDWLRKQLEGGPRRVADLRPQAGLDGLHWRTVERASKAAKVVGSGPKRDRVWTLPSTLAVGGKEENVA